MILRFIKVVCKKSTIFDIEKLRVSVSANLVVDECVIFWEKATILTKNKY